MRMIPRRTYSPTVWRISIGLFLAWGCFICVMVGRSILLPQPIPGPGSTLGYMRGGKLLVMHLPAHNGFVDQLIVDDEQGISRGFLPRTATLTNTAMLLPPNLWQMVEQLRAQWCTTPPTLRPVRPDELYDEVALHCSMLRDQIFKVPLDQVPPALTQLIQTIPPGPLPKPDLP